MLSLRDEHQSTVFDMVVKYIKDARIALNYANFGIGYILWFWFVMVYSMGKRDPIVPITVFIFLMTVCALSTDIYPFGWFLMPIYPFMAIAGGYFYEGLHFKTQYSKGAFTTLGAYGSPVERNPPGRFI